MCRRAINARLTNPCPGHLGVTRVHARGSARRVFALSLSVYAAAGGREAQRGQTSKYAAARGAYISLGGASGGWKRPGPPASRRPSAEPRRDMQTPERAEPRAARGALGLRPQSAAPDRQPRRRGADSGLPGFWRPWADARGGEEAAAAPSPDAEAMLDGPGTIVASGKLSQYRHPVRLFWPKSKCYDYLYQEAEALLKNFPIQATISFYEDSDSEDEIEELTCEN
ncbi:protein ripply2 [Manis javanica]|uniref:protein ripply2 n=1 Tax=Manis javanica TaxID=9974 RepID=UPI003C6D2BEC